MHSPFLCHFTNCLGTVHVLNFSLIVNSLQDFPLHTTKIQQEQNIAQVKYIHWTKFKYAGFYLEGKILLESERK